jgi:hypothetical protein
MRVECSCERSRERALASAVQPLDNHRAAARERQRARLRRRFERRDRAKKRRRLRRAQPHI